MRNGAKLAMSLSIMFGLLVSLLLCQYAWLILSDPGSTDIEERRNGIVQNEQVLTVITEHRIGCARVVATSLPKSIHQLPKGLSWVTFYFDRDVEIVAGRTYSVKLIGADMCLDQLE